jgi:hypothetical protein
MSWLYICIAFLLLLTGMILLPLWRHPTLPRRKKIALSILIFLLIVPVTLILYGAVGVPMMALL